jgi:hypothetical protein
LPEEHRSAAHYDQILSSFHSKLELMKAHPTTTPQEVKHAGGALLAIQLTKIGSWTKTGIFESEIIGEPHKKGQ